MELLTLTKH